MKRAERLEDISALVDVFPARYAARSRIPDALANF